MLCAWLIKFVIFYGTLNHQSLRGSWFEIEKHIKSCCDNDYDWMLVIIFIFALNLYLLLESY